MALTVKHNTLTTESGSTPPIGAVQWDEAHEIIGTVSLATEVAGTLPIANGGTNATSASAALTSLGAYPATNPSGYTANAGTVTSVAGAGTVSGLTLTGSITSTGSLTLGGTLSLTSGNVTTALGYTPYDATNPTGYITSSALSSYLTSATAATTYQPIDGDLTAIAALAGTTGIVRKTAADTYTLDTATYLTGITSGQVTTALGFTPYDAANPSAYLSTVSLTSNVTGTLPAANGGTGLSSPGTSGNVLTSNGSAWVSQLPAAGGITYTTVKTANYTAAANDGVQTSTSGGAFTVTLPATPAVGDQVIVTDSAGSWATNNLTVGRNGSTIESAAEDLVCNISNVSVQLVYNGTTWDVFAQVGGASGLVDINSQTSGTLTVSRGGTGATTLTGYVKGSGTSAMTASAAIPVADVTGAAPLASPTFTGTVTTATADLLGSVRSNITTVAASAVDCSLGNYFIKTATGALTWTATNIPSTRAYSFILELTNGGTGAQTWYSGIKWPGGTAPTLTASGVDVLGFITDDGGTTWRGVQLMKDSK